MEKGERRKEGREAKNRVKRQIEGRRRETEERRKERKS